MKGENVWKEASSTGHKRCSRDAKPSSFSSLVQLSLKTHGAEATTASGLGMLKESSTHLLREQISKREFTKLLKSWTDSLELILASGPWMYLSLLKFCRINMFWKQPEEVRLHM